MYRIGGGMHPVRSCRPAVGHAQELLNRFFMTDGIQKCLDLLEHQRQARLAALPRDAEREVLVADARSVSPLEIDCWFGSDTDSATRGFQAATFEDPKEWDGKIGPKTWSHLEEFLRTGECPLTMADGSQPTPPTATPPTSGCKTPTNPDLSGRAENPTTDAESVIWASNLLSLLDVRAARNGAVAAAAASGLRGPHLGPQDAFRHCNWNCRMVDRMGVAQAEKFATAHENSAPSSIPFDNQMDLHNNARSRRIPPGSNCDRECAALVASGELRTVRRKPAVTATCIGASDQVWP